jgi:hypothetical protein
VTEAYANAPTPSIDLQAVKFNEAVVMASSKTVILTGGYPCDFGSRIGASLIKGSLTVGGGSGTVTIDGVSIY